jgi:cytochrome c oxidase assembly protein subunit 15
MIGVLTVAAVYFLILVGGIVRSTGSGMGCPDWPKCFGSWVPPTHVSQLPADYLEVYKEKRVAKNQRVAGFLDRMGFKSVAADIFAHPSTYIETDFNATKTWIEYLNRLVGVVIGLLIFLTLLFSFSYWKKDWLVVFLSFLSLLLVVFQGWLGSLVVSTNLLPVMITLHMGLALVLVAVLIFAIARSQSAYLAQRRLPKSGRVYGVLLAALLLSFVQIILGTQVREQIDSIAFALGNQFRDTWVQRLGLEFFIHRSFSLVLLIVNVYLAHLLLRVKDRFVTQQVYGMLGLVFVGILTGIMMAYFSVPAVLQPVHLFGATLIFGVQMMLFITYYYAALPVFSPPVARYSKV